MSMVTVFRKSTVLAVALATFALTGCVNNAVPQNPGVSPSADSGSNPPVDHDAVALLPEQIADAGKLVIGFGGTYPPNEFKDETGRVIGWDIEIAEAMAATLGLEVEWKESTFDNVIPSVMGGAMDLGVSSFTDTLEREKQVDFVNYYNAGILWASPAGTEVDPDNACGLTVAVKSTTFEETVELPAKSAACVDAGKAPIKLLKFNTQDDVANAVVLGRADAMSADSPITGYAVAQTEGKLQLDGEAFDVAPYGIAVAKDSDGLVEAVQAALQTMVDNGTYLEVLDRWNVASGAVDTITINAAANTPTG